MALRRVLVVAVITAAVLGGAPGSPARGEPPRTAVRTIPVDDWGSPSGAGSAAPGEPAWVESAAIPAGDAVMVGADWGAAAGVRVQVRQRRDDEWGPWRELAVDDVGPDEDSAEWEDARHGASASEPLWLGRSDAVAVRVAGDESPAVALHLVDSIGGDGLAYQPPESREGAGYAYARAERPAIVPRLSWGADESLRSRPPTYSTRVRFAYVHHTAGSNDYLPEEADDVIRSIYAYHVDVRGMSDIAYNFLVDRYGRLYEGRFGGVTLPVEGGHTGGFNGGSTGVSALGCFQPGECTGDVEPPEAMVEALDALLAWKLDVHHIDPHGTTTEIAGAASTVRYQPGDHVTLPTILGHRDTNLTSCPGDQLYLHVYDAAAADRVDEIGTPKIYGGPPFTREQPLVGERPRWDVTFTEPLDWRLEIRGEDGEVVRATGGTDDAVDLSWDMRAGDGSVVPAGGYSAVLSAGTARPVVTALDVTDPAERRSGVDRVATAIALSEWAFETSRRVVLASAEAFPDALVATPLAGSLGAPVLLTPSDGLPVEVVDEIVRLGATEVLLVGGEARLGEQIEQDLVEDADIAAEDITRLAGETRYHTAAEVAELVIAREGPDEVLLALGDHADPTRAFPDALSAGAYGAARDLPVLLVQGTVLPDPTAELLASREWSDGVTIFGGTRAVRPSVETEARAATGSSSRRFAGGDRYDTARIAAEDLLERMRERDEERGFDPEIEQHDLEVVLATGSNWPDALGAGAAADARDAIFLLVDGVSLAGSVATHEWLEQEAGPLAHAVISGGTAAVSDAVRLGVAAIVESDGPNLEPAEQWPDDPGVVEPSPSPSYSPTVPPYPSPSDTGVASDEPSEPPSDAPSGTETPT